MGIESATYLGQLNASNPAGTDPLADADNHLRLIKQVLKNTFPNLNGPVSATASQFTGLVPVGTIMMFYNPGEDLPPGWAICDGRVVARSDGSGAIATPNLQDLIVVGVSATKSLRGLYGNASQTIQTADAGDHNHGGNTDARGNHNHGGTQGTALTVAQIPAHAHGFVAAIVGGGGGTGLYQPSFAPTNNLQQGTENTGGGQAHSHGLNDDGNHAHGLNIQNGGTHRHNVSIDMTPRCIALYYIMKI